MRDPVLHFEIRSIHSNPQAATALKRRSIKQHDEAHHIRKSSACEHTRPICCPTFAILDFEKNLLAQAANIDVDNKSRDNCNKAMNDDVTCDHGVKNRRIPDANCQRVCLCNDDKHDVRPANNRQKHLNNAAIL